MSPEQSSRHKQREPNSTLPLIERDEEGIDLEGLGSLLKHRRVSLGLTRAETSRMAFMSDSYMRKIENAVLDNQGRLAQPGPEILQNWVKALKWDDEPHFVVIFEMAGYRVENYMPGSIGRVPRNPEQEELLTKVRELLETASQRPRIWRETRELLDPYLDYIRFRITGSRGEIFSSASQNSDKTKPFVDPNSLPDFLTVNEVASILRIAPLTLKRWGNRGKLVPIRISSRGDRRYKKEDVLKFINPKADESLLT